ncbi:hypothetical protein [Archangium sp.]|uniref:hypothetical protein n=1 Tax=Archangium sp. TaxID=1872627 RepID=UPI00389A7E33
MHQVLARAFHPYYGTKDENFSTNDCIGGWRLCSPKAVYDTAGSGGPWGVARSGAGAFYGGYLNNCPLTSDSASGWGIGLNASWSYGDSGVRSGHPKGSTQ